MRRKGARPLPSCAHAASPGACASPAARHRRTRRCTKPATAEAALTCLQLLALATATACCCCLLQCPQQLVQCLASTRPGGRLLLLVALTPPAAVHWCCQRLRPAAAAAAQGQGSAVASLGVPGVPAVLCCHLAAAPQLPWCCCRRQSTHLSTLQDNAQQYSAGPTTHTASVHQAPGCGAGSTASQLSQAAAGTGDSLQLSRTCCAVSLVLPDEQPNRHSRHHRALPLHAHKTHQRRQHNSASVSC
jgi:hypothetical protein